MQGRKRTCQLTGFNPQTLHVPFDKTQQQQLWQTCLSWQVALADSVGILDNHPPAHKLLQFISLTSIVWPRVTEAMPIPGTPTYFTDGSNNGKGDITGPDKRETLVTSHTSAQRVELVAVITILVSKEEKAMASHSSTLAWKIPWTEEPGRLQSMGSLRVGHDWATSLSLSTFMHWRRKWQPTPAFLPGESQGRGSLVGCPLWGRTESGTTEVT